MSAPLTDLSAEQAAHTLRTHTLRVCVQPEDIDELNHVNNVVYLVWCELAARAHSDRVGMTLPRLMKLGAVAVARRHDITYHIPALLGDEVEVWTNLVSSQGIRARREYTLTRVSDQKRLAECFTDWVWVDPVSGRPKRPNPEIVEAFGF
ncbi:acyl-CoA thioesterase [Deinococcus psychrotolerans]|uniref:Acyl-CoA thioesterase n=1 Tax=Deinococcus psychrotolerans TaxID=2489213 RepID=A0A3G8Y7X7_9DEIO|nr:acyl-CoA thioesterase [Deinococcus psychrotolerans]AZI41482.1 acyl-CoA thioesterase [Deinococcus psychrotolerans]